MITPSYVQTMAKYNAWQNQNLIAAASILSDEDRRQDRSAFFGSIFGTFNHILWADMLWMARFQNAEQPTDLPIDQSSKTSCDWPSFLTARAMMDEHINAWAQNLTDQDLEGSLTWRSGVSRQDMTRPLNLLVMHLFNHQTHHRGQIHTMLCQAGAKPGATDLPWMDLS